MGWAVHVTGRGDFGDEEGEAEYPLSRERRSQGNETVEGDEFRSNA